MPTPFIQKVARRAKQIRQGNPRMAWPVALKKAAAELKGGSGVRGIGSVKTKAARKATPAKKSKVSVKKVTVKKVSTSTGIGSIGATSTKAMSGLNNALSEIERCDKHIGALRAKKVGATKSEKAAIDREIKKAMDHKKSLGSLKSMFKKLI